MFKLRTPGAASGGAVQPPTIEAVRKRARHRLIGASVLVLAGVIGLPLLFDKQPRPVAVDFPIDLPAKQVIKAAPPSETAPPPAVKVEGLDAKEEVLSTSTPVPPAAEPSPVAKAESVAKTEQVAEPTVRIVVQVGAFADANRAREARSKLEKAGLKTYTHVAETPEGKRIRVRAGPFATRAEADKAALKAKSVGLPAAILTL
jgi:DedD protein